MFNLVYEKALLIKYIHLLSYLPPNDEYIHLCRICHNMGILLFDGAETDLSQRNLGHEYLLTALHGYQFLMSEYPFISEYHLRYDEITKRLIHNQEN